MIRFFGLRPIKMAALTMALTLTVIGAGVDAHAAATPLNWTSPSTTIAPPGREFATMTYDSLRGRTVLFGGDAITPVSSLPPPPYFADTWEWDGVTWIQTTPSASPQGLTASAMAFDSARGVSVLFGGSTNSGAATAATWEWNGNAWTQRPLVVAPSARVWHAMAYDSARGRIVLFGGDSGGALGDTWEFDGVTWTQRFPVTSPSPRFGQAMAFDSARSRVVMFGGHNDTGRLNDTWEWDGANWSQRSSSSVPYPRAFHSMAFDTNLGRTILFGGDHIRPFALGPVNDTWEWDGTQWTQDWTATAPIPRLGQSMVYDSAHSRSVMFGGTNGVAPRVFYTDTWELGTGISTPVGNPNATVNGFSGFNPTVVGTTSPPAGSILSSTGTGPLLITSITTTGDFAVANTDCPITPNPLAAGSFCLVLVTFTPTATGSRQGTLAFADNGPGGGQQVGISGIATAIPTTLAVAQVSATYGGTTNITATLTARGLPVPGKAVSFTLPNGAAATVPTDANGIALWVAASVARLHAGSYPGGVQASFAGDQVYAKSVGGAALVLSQLGSLTYSGDFYVADTAGPALSVVVDQRLSGSDPQFIDFSALPVSVRFDIVGPNASSVIYRQVVDAPDWASTGRGLASASLSPLPDGAYVVTATFAGTGFPGPRIDFITGDDARVGLVSSPTQGGFLSGGGAIASDPSANTNDAHGYFAFGLEPGRAIQGNLVYNYRTKVDPGDGSVRDVDVVVISTGVTSLDGNSATGHVKVAFIDSQTGAHYSSLEFSGCTFTLTVADGGAKSSDGFALVLVRPDGTLFHATAPLNSRGGAPLVPVVLGDIVSNL